MAQEQTAYVGDDIKVLVNVIDSSGSHVAAVINTSTTRLDGLSAAPTVTTIATGIYQIVFSGVTPAPSEGDRLIAKINGSISGTAWTEYGIPVVVVAEERGTENASPSRYYTFNDSNGTDYVDVYTDIDVAKNLPKVQKAIVRLKLSGNASSSSDWRLHLHVPSGNPSSGFDLLDGVTLPTSLSNYILQAEVDITSCDNVDGSWSIVFEDFNYYGSVLSINDAAVEFSDVPIPSVGGDATAANQTAISNAIAALNDFDPATDAVANVTNVSVCASNSDMRGTDGANTVAPDNAGITSNGLAIAALNDFDPVADTVANVTNVSVCASNSDMRGTDGANTVAPDNAGITANGTAISALNNITVQQVWDALTSGSYASGSFGERLLTSQGTHRTVQVTGSHHVAADVHEFQNDSITASAIAADAVTELQTGLVTVGTAFTYTNGAGDTHNVTIS